MAQPFDIVRLTRGPIGEPWFMRHDYHGGDPHIVVDGVHTIDESMNPFRREACIRFALERLDSLAEIASSIRRGQRDAVDGFRDIVEIAFVDDYSWNNLGHIIGLEILAPTVAKAS